MDSTATPVVLVRTTKSGPSNKGIVLAVGLSLALTTTYDSPVLALLPRALTEALIVAIPVLAITASLNRLSSRRFAVAPLAVAACYSVAVLAAAFTTPRVDDGLFLTVAPAASALVFAAVGSVMSKGDVILLSRITGLLATVQVLLAVCETYLQTPWAIQIASGPNGYLVRNNLVVDGWLRATGSMGHPILFGAICTVAAVMALNPAVIRSTIMRVAFILLMTSGVLMSGSRSSLAALGLAIIVYFLHPGSHIKRSWRLLIGAASLPVAVVYILTTASDAQESSPFSISNRLDAWPRFIAALSRESPTFWFGEGRSFSLETVADNQFLTTTGQYGVFGLAAVVAAMIFAVLSRNPTVSALASGVALLSLSFNILSFSFMAVVMWILVGLSSGDDTSAQPVQGVSTSARLEHTGATGGQSNPDTGRVAQRTAPV